MGFPWNSCPPRPAPLWMLTSPGTAMPSHWRSSTQGVGDRHVPQPATSFLAAGQEGRTGPLKLGGQAGNESSLAFLRALTTTPHRLPSPRAEGHLDWSQVQANGAPKREGMQMARDLHEQVLRSSGPSLRDPGGWGTRATGGPRGCWARTPKRQTLGRRLALAVKAGGSCRADGQASWRLAQKQPEQNAAPDTGRASVGGAGVRPKVSVQSVPSCDFGSSLGLLGRLPQEVWGVEAAVGPAHRAQGGRRARSFQQGPWPPWRAYVRTRL